MQLVGHHVRHMLGFWVGCMHCGSQPSVTLVSQGGLQATVSMQVGPGPQPTVACVMHVNGVQSTVPMHVGCPAVHSTVPMHVGCPGVCSTVSQHVNGVQSQVSMQVGMPGWQPTVC